MAPTQGPVKILSEGAEKGWWVGKKSECERCHAVVQFELGDNVKEYRDTIGTKIMYSCPMCLKLDGKKYENILWFKRTN